MTPTRREVERLNTTTLHWRHAWRAENLQDSHLSLL
jgi:hypothetical protein